MCVCVVNIFVSAVSLFKRKTLSLSSLLSVCNSSQNSSQLVQLDTDITERVVSAQLEASGALISASVAFNVVRVCPHC